MKINFYFQAIDMFMSSCTFFVFLSLIEYAFVNVMMGDIRYFSRKDFASVDISTSVRLRGRTEGTI